MPKSRQISTIAVPNNFSCFHRNQERSAFATTCTATRIHYQANASVFVLANGRNTKSFGLPYFITSKREFRNCTKSKMQNHVRVFQDSLIAVQKTKILILRDIFTSVKETIFKSSSRIKRIQKISLLFDFRKRRVPGIYLFPGLFCIHSTGSKKQDSQEQRRDLPEEFTIRSPSLPLHGSLCRRLFLNTVFPTLLHSLQSPF